MWLAYCAVVWWTRVNQKGLSKALEWLRGLAMITVEAMETTLSMRLGQLLAMQTLYLTITRLADLTAFRLIVANI